MIIVLIYNYLYNLYLYNHVIIYFIVFFGVLCNVKFNRKVVFYPFFFIILLFWTVFTIVEVNCVFLNKILLVQYIVDLI